MLRTNNWKISGQHFQLFPCPTSNFQQLTLEQLPSFLQQNQLVTFRINAANRTPILPFSHFHMDRSILHQLISLTSAHHQIWTSPESFNRFIPTATKYLGFEMHYRYRLAPTPNASGDQGLFATPDLWRCLGLTTFNPSTSRSRRHRGTASAIKVALLVE
jgi:hypothetical protein